MPMQEVQFDPSFEDQGHQDSQREGDWQWARSMCVRGTVGKPCSQNRELIVLSCSNKLVLRAQISQLSQIVCLLHIRAVTYDDVSL